MDTLPSIRNLFATRGRRAARRTSARLRPTLMSLEGRQLLSTFTVINTDDSGPGSLRDAIAQAQSGANLGVADTIDFSALFSTPQIITLTSGQLTLTDAATTTIEGPGAGLLSIGFNNAGRVFDVAHGASAVMSGLTVTGGTVTGPGGGILSDGVLSMTDCTISGNVATGASGLGGGLFSATDSTLSLTDCSFYANSSSSFGGGIGMGGASAFHATLTGCTLSGNSSGSLGGGIFSNGSHVSITDSTVSNNTGGAGGGLWLGGGASTNTLAGCIISGNFATAGNGGGLYTSLSGSTLTDCSIIGNSASGHGGGMFTYGAGFGAGDTLTDTTISSNSAGQSGGGVASVGLVNGHVTNSTIGGNTSGQSGGGLIVLPNPYNPGTWTIGNSILADNVDSAGTPDASSLPAKPFLSLGHNLIGEADGSSGWIASDLKGTVLTPIDPLLAPAGHYGGPSPTMALLPGSPAIDAGDNALIPAGITLDQRGFARIVNGTVDIGAFESGGFTITVTSGDGQSTDLNTAFSAPLVATVTANNLDEPVDGGQVTFTAPATGASASIDGSPATIGGGGHSGHGGHHHNRSSDSASVTATANGIGGSYLVSATALGVANSADFSLTNTGLLTPTFSGLSSPTIVYGTSTTTLTGQLGAGTSYPVGTTVSITLNSVVQTAVVDADGDFTTTFSTSSLGVAGGPYTVTYDFAGSPGFGPATDASTSLTVTPAPLTATAVSTSMTYGTAVPTLTYTYSGLVNGETSATFTGALATTATSSSLIGAYPITQGSLAATGNYAIVTFIPGTLTVTPFYFSGGFLAPIGPKASFKQGSTIPVKWQVTDVNGHPVTGLSAIASLTVAGPGGTATLYPGNNNSSGATALRNDGGQYVYNWQTKGFAVGAYTITATFADGNSISQTIVLGTNGGGPGSSNGPPATTDVSTASGISILDFDTNESTSSPYGKSKVGNQA